MPPVRPPFYHKSDYNIIILSNFVHELKTE
nr:MAG TPA: hypothetical protein [Caudoviricetes sp.]